MLRAAGGGPRSRLGINYHLLIGEPFDYRLCDLPDLLGGRDFFPGGHSKCMTDCQRGAGDSEEFAYQALLLVMCLGT